MYTYLPTTIISLAASYNVAIYLSHLFQQGFLVLGHSFFTPGMLLLLFQKTVYTSYVKDKNECRQLIRLLVVSS